MQTPCKAARKTKISIDAVTHTHSECICVHQHVDGSFIGPYQQTCSHKALQQNWQLAEHLALTTHRITGSTTLTVPDTQCLYLPMHALECLECIDVYSARTVCLRRRQCSLNGQHLCYKQAATTPTMVTTNARHAERYSAGPTKQVVHAQVPERRLGEGSAKVQKHS